MRPRRTLTLAVIVLVGSASAALVLAERGRRARLAASERMLEEHAAAAEREFADFIRPLRTQLDLLRGWGEQGLLNLEAAAVLEAALRPTVESLDQVAAIRIADSDGREYTFVREAQGWRSIWSPEPDRGYLASDWYHGAVEELGAPNGTWTNLDTRLGDTGTRLHTAAAWIPSDKDGAVTQVAALEIARAAVDTLRSRLPHTERSMLGILTRSDRLLIFPAAGELESIDYRDVFTSDDPATALISEILLHWHRHGRPYGEPFRIPAAGTTWFALFRPAGQGAEPGALFLLVPVADLSARIETMISPRIGVLLGIVGAALLALIRLAVRDRAHLEELAAARRGYADVPEEELVRLIAAGESDRLEFKSTLRWNLKSGKPGKEVELAWLKTVVAFLNSDGGTLLIGVADDGTILGTGADGFSNDDKYLLHFTNCLNQHIGVEYARFVKARLRELDRSRVLVVDCVPADKPAFLRSGEDEDLYVRVGPASRRLSVKKALEYVQDRRARRRLARV